MTRSEKPSLSDQKQITFSKDEIFAKFCQFYDKKRINKNKKWIEFILHCFYVDIQSFSMDIIDFLSFFWIELRNFSFPYIRQKFQMNFGVVLCCFDNMSKFLFLTKLSFNLDATKISKCCMINVLIIEIEYNVVIPTVHSTHDPNSHESWWNICYFQCSRYFYVH